MDALYPVLRARKFYRQERKARQENLTTKDAKVFAKGAEEISWLRSSDTCPNTECCNIYPSLVTGDVILKFFGPYFYFTEFSGNYPQFGVEGEVIWNQLDVEMRPCSRG